MNFEVNDVWNTMFLTDKSSFLGGLWSIVNISWNYYSYNNSESWEIADSKALASDFFMIWKDINDSLSGIV